MEKIIDLHSKNKLRIGIIVIVFGVFLIEKIPYLTLFSQYSVGFTIWLFSLIIAGFDGYRLFKIALSLFVLMIITTLLSENTITENIGNATFLILLSGAVVLIYGNLKKSL